MKPIPQNTTRHREQDDQRSTSGRRNLPKVDYAYRTTHVEATRCPEAIEKTMAEARTFRKVSQQFMEKRAGREFRAEAFFFAWITLTTAWPLGVLVRQLTTMMIRY